jgi:hypothetical protein
MKRTGKVIVTAAAAVLLVFLVLMIPDPPDKTIRKAGEKPFVWNKDDLWKGLEKTFREETTAVPVLRDAQLLKLKTIAESALAEMESGWLPPDDPVFINLLNNFFTMAPVVAAGKQPDDWFIGYYNRVRNIIKVQSQHWDMNSKIARNTIYQVLYGMRAAVEEVLLQSPGMTFDPVMSVKDELSATPSATIFGITVHSGDLLVSRGGAVVSALISRGNDYPGNFSHVAMIYVDEKTGVSYLVEAHIERGVAVSSVARYIADKKLRFMVMRPRNDLPQLVNDPMIPHKAAEYIYREALTRHIPYDFKMNFHDPSSMFCSEVGSSAYQRYGIMPWQVISTISSPGVVRLLHEFGVENFVTMMPSDLEYDPQLAVVAEWRDPQTLLKDHIFNAVMDVMLEHSDTEEVIRINPWMLPFARIVKGYSVLLNLFHKEGPIPEGMSATQGLKNNAFEDLHSRIRSKTEEKVRLFIARYGYIPPYWQLIAMAKESWPIR